MGQPSSRPRPRGEGEPTLGGRFQRIWLCFWPLTEERSSAVCQLRRIKDGLSKYLARAKKKNEPIVVTHQGKSYALIQPLLRVGLRWRGMAPTVFPLG